MRLSRLPHLAAGAVLSLVTACSRQPGPSTPPQVATAAADAADSSPADAASTTATPASAASFVLRGGRVLTATGISYDAADVYVEHGRIAAVGPAIETPTDVPIVDVRGMTVTPGIVDTHSHMGVYAAPRLDAHSDGNEATRPVTADARARDGYWPQDPQLERARAAGVTTIQVLPGSANLIGGRSFTAKLVPGARSATEAKFPGAPDGLKMACGENPKRVYGDKGGPQTRMGNVAGYRRAFQQAVEYRRRWNDYERRRATWSAKNEDDSPPEPPSRDLGLETLAKVLDGEILVHNHCYRADEMVLMLEVAEEFGFKIRSFHHAVEAYKIADRLAAAGTSASMWSDWWGFKAEAYDGIRENAAMVSAAGARAIIHSDSGITIQRLNQDAAKAMHAGRRAGLEISEDEALRWITANPAWALGIEQHTGSLEPGKMADIVVWSGSPFSVYTHAEKVYIDGSLVYDRQDPAHQPRSDFELGHRQHDLDGVTP
ncbi:MAG: amidohydrolase [Myxococcales bacterium FL481]|nr:MAG: amidohydrolase [Myxococcales bacterium FL481]